MAGTWIGNMEMNPGRIEIGSLEELPHGEVVSK